MLFIKTKLTKSTAVVPATKHTLDYLFQVNGNGLKYRNVFRRNVLYYHDIIITKSIKSTVTNYTSSHQTAKYYCPHFRMTFVFAVRKLCEISQSINPTQI